MPVLQSQRAIGGPLSKRKESKGKQEEKRRKKESRTGKEDDRRVGKKKKLKEPTSQEEESEGEEMPKLLKEFAKEFYAEELLWKLLQKCSPQSHFGQKPMNWEHFPVHTEHRKIPVHRPSGPSRP